VVGKKREMILRVTITNAPNYDKIKNYVSLSLPGYGKLFYYLWFLNIVIGVTSQKT
jgi:hypothetical protein